MTEQSVFKGHPVLTLRRSEDDKYPFTFGLSKAKLMLAHIKEIEAFVKANTEESK